MKQMSDIGTNIRKWFKSWFKKERKKKPYRQQFGDLYQEYKKIHGFGDTWSSEVMGRFYKEVEEFK